MKILIMGLPGSGKTFLAKELHNQISLLGRSVSWFNADIIREKYNDWDFTKEGRIRQSVRMNELSNESGSDFVICDFVAPLPEMRDNYKADLVVWVDTLTESRFEDTNQMFTNPEKYDIRVTEQNCEYWSSVILNSINSNNSNNVINIL